VLTSGNASFCLADSVIYIHFSNYLYHSLDTGKTWNVIHDFKYENSDTYNNLPLSPISCINKDTLFVVWKGTSYRSIDAGVSWQTYSAIPDFATNSYMGRIIQKDGVLYWDKSGNLLKSTDRGNTWKYALKSDTAKGYYGKPQIISKDTIIIASGSDNSWISSFLLCSYNGGNTWFVKTPGNNFKFTKPGYVYFTDSKTGYYFTKDINYKSKDGGITWYIISSLNLGQQCYFLNNKIGFTYGNKDLIYKTVTSGQTPLTVKVTDLFRPQTKYVYISYQLFSQTNDPAMTIKKEYSLDNGLTWKNASISLDKEVYPISSTYNGAGSAYHFYWNSAKDVTGSSSALFRVTPIGKDSAGVSDTINFNIDRSKEFIVLGNEGDERGFDISATTDGGQVMLSYATYDVRLYKLNKFQELEWERNYDSLRFGFVEAGFPDGIIMSGESMSGKGYIYKLKNNGTLEWIRGTGNGTIYDITKGHNSGFVGTGINETRDSLIVMAFNNEGKTLWKNSIKVLNGNLKGSGYGIEDYKQTIIPANDSCYVISGTYFSSDKPKMFITKISHDGKVVWMKEDELRAYEFFNHSVQATKNNEYVIAGSRASTNSSYLHLMKFDINGNLLYSTTPMGIVVDNYIETFDMKRTLDDGFLIAGTHSSPQPNSSITLRYILLVKLNSKGEYQWSKTYPAGRQDVAYAISETRNNKYCIVGKTNGFGIGDYFMDPNATSSTSCNLILFTVDQNGNYVSDFSNMDQIPVCKESDTLYITSKQPVEHWLPAEDFSTIEITKGNLPSGLILDNSSGKIAGTTAYIGECELTLKALNSFGYDLINLLIIANTSTSISEQKKSGFNFYPNPASENITIVNSNGGNIKSIKLTDNLGKVVMSHSVETSGSIDVSLSHIPSGIYLLQVITADDLFTQKISIK
ncbi:MAG: T9SS type A sorting domain-containing protein, partial [Sporocytophaga sp.]|uniref:T9SS type A sorting domain-containing protein n=1 Tax=Sporocytophaga sp. TaxID=2231183 RepID=UPI001B28BEA8